LDLNIFLIHFSRQAAQEVGLFLFDSNSGEVVEDSASSSFKVLTDLQMIDVKEEPKSSDYFYGNQLTFKFSIKDSVSNRYLSSSNPSLSNVFLILRHQQSKKGFYVSANQSANYFPSEHSQPQGFLIKWDINSNAASGSGVVAIVVEDPDGQTINVNRGKEAATYNVNIGGNIEVQSSVRSTPFDTTQTAFVADFHLTCQGRELKGAQLVAFVSYGGNVLQQIPVATSESGYEVSWSVPHDQAPSGTYELSLYRTVDRQRLSQEATPLTTLQIAHRSAPSQAPVSTSFFVGAALLAAVYFSFLKTHKST